MKKNALVLVNSSFQLMCALEYLLLHDCVDEAQIISSEDQDSTTFKQMWLLAKELGITQFDTLKLQHRGELEKRIASYGEYFAKNIAGNTYQHLLVGDIRHQWMHDFACSAKANNTVMVDDGGAGFSIIKYMLAPQNYTLPLNSTVTALPERQALANQIKAQFGMRIQSTLLQLFSVFHQPVKATHTKNDFAQLVKFYNPKRQFTQLNEIHVIGAPFVEHDFFSQQDYLAYMCALAKLAEHFESAKLVYFMHRFEQDNQIKKAALQSLGFELRQSSINYELGLIKAATKPLAVASILSTSLYNVKALFAEQVEAFYVPLSAKHLNAYNSSHWMVKHYSLAQHWQNIIDNFQGYSILPASSVLSKSDA